MSIQKVASSDGSKVGGLTTEVVGPLGHIQIVGTGFWSPAMIDSHFDELREILRAYRASQTPVRMVVDLRTSSVQSQDVISRMKAGVASITRTGDRIAIIVNSSLAKMQMRRIIGDEMHEFFVSSDAAWGWVKAY